MRSQLLAAIDDALERLPREPHLHAKRDLARQALEDAQTVVALDAGGTAADEATVLHEMRLAQRFAPALVLFETEHFPARDPFVEIGPGPPSPLNDALILAEAAASTALETPWETKLALIGVVAAQLDRTAEIEAELEVPWGTDPVDLSGYERLMALPVADRVEELLREGARGDEDAGV